MSEGYGPPPEGWLRLKPGQALRLDWSGPDLRVVEAEEQEPGPAGEDTTEARGRLIRMMSRPSLEALAFASALCGDKESMADAIRQLGAEDLQSLKTASHWLYDACVAELGHRARAERKDEAPDE